MFDVNLIFAVLLGAFLIWIIGKILLKPIKLVVKLLFNSIIGLVILLALNFIGGFFGLAIAINLVTVLVAGFLGVPGVLLLIVLQYLLG